MKDLNCASKQTFSSTNRIKKFYEWSKMIDPNEDFKPVKNEDAWSQWLSQMEVLKSQYEEHVVLSVVYEY